MTKLHLWNNTDLDNAARGLIARADVREVEIDALVDTGATMLVIPVDVAARLGLPIIDHLPVCLADATVREMPVVGSLRLSILGRTMTGDALAAPVGATALIGQIPLERLDLIVDPGSREIRVNPASPDGPLMKAMGAPCTNPAGKSAKETVWGARAPALRNPSTLPIPIKLRASTRPINSTRETVWFRAWSLQYLSCSMSFILSSRGSQRTRMPATARAI